MKLGDFVAAMAVKFGIDITQPLFAEILSSAVDIPDPVSSLFTNNNSLMSLEAAKNNPTLKYHFTASALNPLDSSVEALMTELELPEEIKAEIKGSKSTYEKIPQLMRKIKEHESLKASASGKDKSDLTTKINELQLKLSEAVTAHNTAISEKEKAHSAELQDFILNSKIASRKLDTSRFDAELMQALARQKVDLEITKRGAKVINQNRTLVLKQAQDEGLDYYENSQPITIDTLIDQVLANNKLLAVTDQSPAPGNNHSGFPPTPPGTGQQARPLSGMSSKLDKALQDFDLGTR